MSGSKTVIKADEIYKKGNYYTAGADQTFDILAVLSLATSIFTFCTSFFGGICCIPFAIIAAIFGILGLKSTQYRSIAIIGIVFSVLSVIFPIILVLCSVAFNITTLNL